MPSVKPSERPLASLPDFGQSPALGAAVTALIQNWRGRDGNDPSVDIAKDADQRF
jgi:hypothetical protein